jgi:hypothetical protein
MAKSPLKHLQSVLFGGLAFAGCSSGSAPLPSNVATDGGSYDSGATDSGSGSVADSTADSGKSEGGTSEGGAGADGSAPPKIPNPRLATLGAGAARDLGAYTCEELAGFPGRSCVSIWEYSGFAYDNVHQQMLMFGSGHAATVRTDIAYLDLQGDLQWQSAYPSTPFSAMTLANMDLDRGFWKSTGHPVQHHTYDQLSWVPETGRLVDFLSNAIVLYGQEYPRDFPEGTRSSDLHEYDPVAKIWSHYTQPMRVPPYGAAEYDPASKRILYLSRYGLWSYDPQSHKVIEEPLILPGQTLSYAQNLVWAGESGVHYYMMADGEVLRLTYRAGTPAQATLTPVRTTGPRPPVLASPPEPSETGWGFDPKRKRVCGGLHEGLIYCFAPASSEWTAHPVVLQAGAKANLGAMAHHAVQFDPVSDVLVFLTKSTPSEPPHTVVWRPTN